MRTLGTCLDCGRRMVSRWWLDKQTPETRANVRAAGYVGKVGRGLCKFCYEDARAAGRLDEYDRTARWRGEVLEELDHLGFDPRRPAAPQLRNIAPRLGMSYKALERAWNRARREGVAA